MLHVSLILKDNSKTNFVEEKKSKKKYLTGTVWEESSVDFNTFQTPCVLTMSGYFSINPDPDTLLS